MGMREDCRHFESRTYDDGEVARYCVLGLAPEQPWRCPEHCDRYEPSLADATFKRGSLAGSGVEREPDDDTPDNIASVLEDAEGIVEAAEHDAVLDLQRVESARARRWWQIWKRRPPDDGPFSLSNR